MVKKHGFTLLELLIVIGLIGILVSISAVSYSSAQKKTRDSRRKSDIKAIQNALEQYYADNNGLYPSVSYNNLAVQYLPGTTKPSDPKTSCYYKQTVNTTSGYTICADLEGVGTFNCSLTCSGVTGSGCLDNDFCVSNLQ